MNKKKLIFGGVILVLVLVAAWYFMYFTKTPGYALNQAREAYTKHDVATFKKYVDVESIVGSGYERVGIGYVPRHEGTNRTDRKQ